jgi:hypothetical protein
MIRLFAHHPDNRRLLLLEDGELPRRAQRSVRRHLALCPQCRRELDRLHDATAEFERYRDEEILPGLPEPRLPWPDLRVAMATFDTAHSRKAPWKLNLLPAARLGRWAAGAALLAGAALAVATVARLEMAHAPVLPLKPRPAPVRPLLPPPVPPPVPAPVSAAESPRPVARPVGDAPPPEPEYSSADTEVRVFAALNRIGADVDDPIEVASGARAQVDVAGLSVPQERQAEIREALAGIPGVVVRFSSHDASGPAPAGPADSRSARPPRGPFDDTLERHLGGRAALDGFANRLLDESDALMTRAQAIHTLLERFPVSRRAELHLPERSLLDGMLGSHRVTYRRHARNVIRLVGQLSDALGTPRAAGARRLDADALAAARRMDRVLDAVFGGATTSLTSAELLAELAAAAAELEAACGENQ